MATPWITGQTDVTNDPAYWRAQLTSSNYKQRKQAELMLRQLENRSELEARQAFQSQNLAEARAQRGEISAARLAQRESEQEDRRQRAQEHQALIAADREARQAALADANATRRAQELQMIAADPNFPEATRNAAKAEIVRSLNLGGAPATAGGAPTVKGEYGPGGAPATAPAPATTQPQPAAASASGYTPPKITGTAGFAPPGTDAIHSGVSFGNEQNYSPPTAAFTGGEPPKVGPNGAVDQGLGFAPNGYPILPNTPEPRYTPLGSSSLEGSRLVNERGKPGLVTPSGGFIGGISATQAAKYSGGAAVPQNPPPNEAATAQPVSGYTPPTTAFSQPNTPVAPQPNPTPGVPPEPALGITKFENAPVPTPAGTPPAIPAVQPQASNDRQDLLRETEGTFYGGGQVPIPTPTPTPVQRVAAAPLPALDPVLLQQLLQQQKLGSRYSFA